MTRLPLILCAVLLVGCEKAPDPNARSQLTTYVGRASKHETREGDRRTFYYNIERLRCADENGNVWTGPVAANACPKGMTNEAERMRPMLTGFYYLCESRQGKRFQSKYPCPDVARTEYERIKADLCYSPDGGKCKLDL